MNSLVIIIYVSDEGVRTFRLMVGFEPKYFPFPVERYTSELREVLIIIINKSL